MLGIMCEDISGMHFRALKERKRSAWNCTTKPVTKGPSKGRKKCTFNFYPLVRIQTKVFGRKSKSLSLTTLVVTTHCDDVPSVSTTLHHDIHSSSQNSSVQDLAFIPLFYLASPSCFLLPIHSKVPSIKVTKSKLPSLPPSQCYG